jgi:carbonic anhydrase/acetyltransferase-like protein (isoleucine patch superfamily)
MGSPGKVVRTLTEDEIARMHTNTARYAERAANYAEKLSRI